MNRAVSPHLRRLLARAASPEAGGSAGLESAGADTITPAAADDILHRAANLMKRIPADEIDDPRDYERALAIFLGQAEQGLRGLTQNDDNVPDPDAAFALEAVIRADGTRPSFLVKKASCDPQHPLAGNWQAGLTNDPALLSKRIAAVGRIEPANGSSTNYFGTGWLVDRMKGLILTNLHVLEQMWGRLANRMLPDGSGGYRVLGDAAFIDFVGESGSLEKHRFRIVAGVPSGIDGPGHQRLDMAVLRIEPITAGPYISPELPDAIPVVADADCPSGNSSFCMVGYPGRPPYAGGLHEKVDWNWVNSTLFGNKFGVKRLAPGEASTPVGSMPNDPHNWVFGHDATTLGGSSGSPALAWFSDGKGGVGLHFSGATLVTNCAHAVIRMKAELIRLGVPVVEPD